MKCSIPLTLFVLLDMCTSIRDFSEREVFQEYINRVIAGLAQKVYILLGGWGVMGFLIHGVKRTAVQVGLQKQRQRNGFTLINESTDWVSQ